MKRFASTRSEKRASQPRARPGAVERRLHRGRGNPVRVDHPRLDRQHDRDRAGDRHDPVDRDPPAARQVARRARDRVAACAWWLLRRLDRLRGGSSPAPAHRADRRCERVVARGAARDRRAPRRPRAARARGVVLRRCRASSKRSRPVVGVADLVLRGVRRDAEHGVEVAHRALRARLCSRRQSSIRPWSPESSTSGHPPAAELGRAACTADTRPRPRAPAENVSCSADPSASAPGWSRAIASTSTIAGSSPPDSTYGPIEIASEQRCVRIRSSKPSKRAESSVSRSSPASSSTTRLVELPALRRQARSPGDRARRRRPRRARLRRRRLAGPFPARRRRARRRPGRSAAASCRGSRRGAGRARCRARSPSGRCSVSQRERVRNQGEDVDLQRRVEVTRLANPAATTTRARLRGRSARTHSSCIGSARPESSSRTSFATPGATSRTAPSRRPPSSTTSSPTSSKT